MNFGLEASQQSMYEAPQPCDPISNPGLALQISPFHLDDGLNSASTWGQSAITPADSLNNPWMLSYEGHSSSGSPSALSATPPPNETQTPPHVNMYMPPEASYSQMHIAVAGADNMVPTVESLGVSFNHQIDMNYNPVDGDVPEYQTCLEQQQQQQMFNDMSQTHHHYIPELEAHY
jgi:hypothetical protein